MAGSLTEVREELASKRQEMHRIFEEAGQDLDLNKVTFIYGDSAGKAAEIQRREAELRDLNDEYNRLALLASIGQNNELQKQSLTEPAARPQFSGNGGAGEQRQFKAQN